MATYYVSTKGSDANAGTSSKTAWKTFTKLLGTSGISSGDTAYIEAGIYREVVIINMTSPTIETKIIGDVEGRYFGTIGDIILTPYLVNDESAPATTQTLRLNNRDFLSFENLYIIGANASNGMCVFSGTGGSTDIKLTNCVFFCPFSSQDHAIRIDVLFGATANWFIDKCIFVITGSSGYAFEIFLTTGTGSDYNANIKITNCFFYAMTAIEITSSGTSSQEGGGVIVSNCTFFTGLNAVVTGSARIGGSTFTYPVTVKNCLIFNRANSAAISANELGAIIEDYNVIVCTLPRTNVRIGPNTVADGSMACYLYLGQEYKYLGTFKRFASPLPISPLIGQGNQTADSINDCNSLLRPKGNPNFLFSGYATSSTELSLSDNTKIFPSGNLIGYTVQIVDGLGKGQTKTINENHTGQLFVDGNWLTNLNTTSKYYIYNGLISSSGPVSGVNANNTLVSSGSKWGHGFWRGYTCFINSGTSSGNTLIVSGNSENTLTGFNNWTVNPDNTSAYELSWGSGSSNSGINYLHSCVGYSEVYDTAQIQSGNTISGSSAIQMFGMSSHNFEIPVTGGSNNISVMGYYDSLYSGTKPQLLITNCGNVGIDETSGIMTVGANTWEQISVNIIPSGNGVVTAKLLANSSGAMGITYFDSFSIS